MKSLATLGIILATLSISPAGAQDVMGTTVVTGAGSTFAYPVISRWAQAYQRWLAGGGDYAPTGGGLDDPPTGRVLDYEPIGSLAGTMRVRDGKVDFGASDVPLKSEELAKLGLGQFPIVIGGVVAVVNIDGLGANEIRFTGELLADIYLGRITSWGDPAIKAINPGLNLPNAQIAVVHRSDGSGTTYNFAHYLSKASAQWREKVGVDTLLTWPTGKGAKANDGVALAVKQTRNSIGYVEYTHAVQNKLSAALIQNRAGKFVKPDTRSFQSAAAGADWVKTSDFYLLLTDAPGDDAYPIAATVFALMHRQPNRLRNQKGALNFLGWALEKGAKDAAALGYVPLPEALVGQIKDYWAKNLRS